MGNRSRPSAFAAGAVCALAFAACRQQGQQEGGSVAGQVEAAQKQAQEAFRQAQQDQKQGGSQQQQQGAQAQTPPQQPSQPQASAGGAAGTAQQQGQQQTVSGELVQASSSEIRVGPEVGNEVRLRITDSTQVTQNGRAASVNDLQPGSQVRASYNVQQGEAVATRVEVTSPSGSPGAAGRGPSGSMGGASGGPSSPSPSGQEPGSRY